jgi:hypothetical protein
LVRQKKPSVSAAERSCVVISLMRVGKSWREILGMVRVVYFVGAIVDGGLWLWLRVDEMGMVMR